MFKRKKPEIEALNEFWTVKPRNVMAFPANDTTTIGISTGEMIVVRDGEVALRSLWPDVVAARWDADLSVFEITMMDAPGNPIVIKCTNSPTEMFMHSLRESIDQAHIVTVQHRTKSGIDVRLWILRDKDGNLSFKKYVGEPLDGEEANEVARMEYRLKDSVGLA